MTFIVWKPENYKNQG